MDIRTTKKIAAPFILCQTLALSTFSFASDQASHADEHLAEPAIAAFKTVANWNLRCLRGCIEMIQTRGGHFNIAPAFGFLALPWALLVDAVVIPFSASATVATGIGVLGAVAIDGTMSAITHFTATKPPELSSEQWSQVKTVLQNFNTRLSHIRPMVADRQITPEQLYMFALAGTIYDSRDATTGLTLADGTHLELGQLPVESERHAPAHELFKTLRMATKHVTIEEYPDRDTFLRAMVEAEFARTTNRTLTPILAHLRIAAQQAKEAVELYDHK